jgi:hypothetical protein
MFLTAWLCCGLLCLLLHLQTYPGVEKYVERLLEARKGKNLTALLSLFVPGLALSAADLPGR